MRGQDIWKKRDPIEIDRTCCNYCTPVRNRKIGKMNNEPREISNKRGDQEYLYIALLVISRPLPAPTTRYSGKNINAKAGKI